MPADYRTAIYKTPSGWEVDCFSHSQYSTYKTCGMLFKIERIHGWRRKQTAAMDFGICIEESVKAFYSERRDPVEVFEMLWETRKDDARLAYSDKENWGMFNAAGRGLMVKFANTWEDFPPRKPVFPGFKNSIKVRDASTGTFYQTIPDLIDQDAGGRFIADLKAMPNLIDEGDAPGLVAMDMQLRTQAAATKIYRIALWNFCKKPKQVDPPTLDEILSACASVFDVSIKAGMAALWVARETCGLNIDDAGKFIGIENPQAVNKDWKTLCKQEPELKAKAEKIAETINKAHRPQYIIEWVEATIPAEHALAAIREEMSVVPLIQQGYFPRRGGVRFPDNACSWCSCRGLCMEDLLGPRPEYEAITKAELVRVGESVLDGLE